MKTDIENTRPLFMKLSNEKGGIEYINVDQIVRVEVQSSVGLPSQPPATIYLTDRSSWKVEGNDATSLIHTLNVLTDRYRTE